MPNPNANFCLTLTEADGPNDCCGPLLCMGPSREPSPKTGDTNRPVEVVAAADVLALVSHTQTIQRQFRVAIRPEKSGVSTR